MLYRFQQTLRPTGKNNIDHVQLSKIKIFLLQLFPLKVIALPMRASQKTAGKAAAAYDELLFGPTQQF